MNDWVTYEMTLNFLKQPGRQETRCCAAQEVPFAVADGLGAVAGVPLAEEGEHRDGLTNGPQVARIFPTISGKSGTQQQEQNSPNRGTSF